MMVFKHVAQENLGTLKGVLAEAGCRLRYVNFQREPGANPCLDRYQGLIVLGGWMGVYEADQYPHLKLEYQLIEQALKRGIPVLGICLGAQIVAHVLGAGVRKHSQREAGWTEVALTDAGRADPLLSHFKPGQKIFQMHGDTFDMPVAAAHLATSRACANQAFRFADNVYGLQFHLEVDEGMVQHLMHNPERRAALEASEGAEAVARIEAESPRYLPKSNALSRQVFSSFVRLMGLKPRPSSIHGRGR